MELKQGEVICSVCKGTGIISEKTELFEYYHRGASFMAPGIPTKEFCEKCQGKGKLDWIEAIVGKKKLTPGGCGTSGYSNIETICTLDENIKQEIIDEVAEKMKKHIDESILLRLAEFAKGGKI